MDRNVAGVKPRRRYDASGRRRQAQSNRERVLAAARELFLSAGYAATSLAGIAEAADVSVETVYKAFGGKAGLVRAIYEQSLAGSGAVSAEQRSDEMQLRESDPHMIIEHWGRLTREVAPLVAPVLLLIRDAAASDPEMARLYAEADDARHARMADNARRLHAIGGLRPGMSVEETTDVLWTYTSTELFELLAVRRGWSPERFGTFVANGVRAALLPSS
jgi:AcrR family transcriptional regulator